MKQLRSKTSGKSGRKGLFRRRMLWLYHDDTLPWLTATMLNDNDDGDQWHALKAAGPAELVELAISHRPQIIFIYLPPLIDADLQTLKRLCRTLKARFALKDIPVVGFADSLDDFNSTLIDLDMQGYIRQPFTAEEFLECAKRVLSGENYFVPNRIMGSRDENTEAE